MGHDFISETCFTCYKKPINFHKISDSYGDSKLNIRFIICQHFWFKEEDLRSAIVCETCWEKVDHFHQFYLEVKMLHEHREITPLSLFIKQEEITIEETQLQEKCIDISTEDQKLFGIADCKHEMQEECNDLLKKEDPEEVPQPRKKKKYAKRLPNKRVVKRKNSHSKKQTLEERQAEDNLITQHTRYICDECNIEFKNFLAIKYHRIKEHNKDDFVCCGNQYRSRYNLYRHVQSFWRPETFKCEICGESFKSNNDYVRHKDGNHAAEEDLAFKCNRCPKSFIKEGLLKRHLAEHVSLENETAKCELCGKCYRNKYRLNRHVTEVHKKLTDFTCEVCSKRFHDRSVFLKHQKTHELTAQQLKEQCPVCNKWLKNHSNWLEHMRRHQEGECKCEVCGHVSTSMKGLRMHMKNRHAPDRKRYVCELCGKEYKRALSLKEHVANAHTREHPYQCQYCEKKFFSSANMYSHRQKYHRQKWLKDRMSKYARREEVPDGGETVF